MPKKLPGYRGYLSLVPGVKSGSHPVLTLPHFLSYSIRIFVGSWEKVILGLDANGETRSHFNFRYPLGSYLGNFSAIEKT